MGKLARQPALCGERGYERRNERRACLRRLEFWMMHPRNSAGVTLSDMDVNVVNVICATLEDRIGLAMANAKENM